MIRTIVIDDEKRVAKAIARIIDKNCSGFSVIGIANTVKEGVELINKHNPDLVTLDINLPDGSGFEILRKVEDRSFKLIFITAYEEHALKAIKFSAIDYILKPIDEFELAEAFRKAKEIKKKEKNRAVLEAFLSGLADKQKEHKKIALKTTDDIHLVKVNEIIRCESEGGYTSFYLTDGKKLFVSKNLKEYEELLSDFGFVRTHHSHLININYLERFHKADGGVIIMSDKSEVPVSVRRKESIIKMFENL